MTIRRRSPYCLAAVLALVLTAVSAPSGAQDATDDFGVFVDTVDVTVVNVEVMVTDRSGKPVTGLTRDDFQVFEDGEPVELSNFLALSEPSTPSVFDESASGAGVEVEPADGTPAAAGSTEAVPAKREHAIILFDNAHIAPSTRNALITQLRDQIENMMGPNTWVMVVTKDRAIKIVRRMTNDRDLVLAALDRIQETGASGALGDSQERMLMRRLDLGRSQGPSDAGGALSVDLAEQDARDMLSAIEMYAQENAQEVRYTCELLRYFVDSLAGIQGRKALFYVSDGLPLRGGEALFRAWYDKWGFNYGAQLGMTSPIDRSEDFNSTQDLLDLIAHSNANRVAFYPIDTSVGVGTASVSAANPSVSLASTVLAVGENEQVGLGLLAQGTGGRMLPDTSGLGELIDQVRQDFETSYLLGYVSPAEGDGKIHKIEVKVARDGVRLRYRDRYRAKNADQLMTDKTFAALFLDSAENPLDVRIGMGKSTPAEKKKKKEFLLPLEIRMPLSKLSLIPQQAAHVGNLSLFIVVQDDKGRVSPPIKITVPVKIPNAKLAGSLAQNVGYRTKLRVRPGGQKIAVGVRDDISQAWSAVNLTVEVGEG